MDIYSNTLHSSYSGRVDQPRHFHQASSNNSTASSPPDPKTPPVSAGEFYVYGEGQAHSNPTRQYTHQPQSQTLYSHPEHYVETPTYLQTGTDYAPETITSRPQFQPPKVVTNPQDARNLLSDPFAINGSHLVSSSDRSTYPAAAFLPPEAYAGSYGTPQAPPFPVGAPQVEAHPSPSSLTFDDGPPPLERAPIEVIGSFWYDSSPHPPFAPPGPTESISWHQPAHPSAPMYWDDKSGPRGSFATQSRSVPRTEGGASHEAQIQPPSQYHGGMLPHASPSYRASPSISPEILNIPPPLLRPTLNGPFISHQGQHANLAPIPISHHLADLPSPSAHPPPLMRRFSSPLIRREERSTLRHTSSLVMPHLEVAYAIDRRPTTELYDPAGSNAFQSRVQDPRFFDRNVELNRLQDGEFQARHPLETMVGIFNA